MGKAHKESKAPDDIPLRYNHLQKVLNQTPAIICAISSNGLLEHISGSVQELLGYQPSEMTYQNYEKFIHPDDVVDTVENLLMVMEGNAIRDYRNRCLQANGDPVYLRWACRWDSEEELIYCVGVDETNFQKALQEKQQAQDEFVARQREKEEEVRKSLEEKEILLSEIHHRVKNNLAVISGMLQLEAFDERDEKVKAKLMEFVTRIHSIANVHEYLYKASSFSQLNFAESLQSLVEKVVETVQGDMKVCSEFILDPVQLNVNQAMPFSMIVNEVISHILKHSFKSKEKGAIKAELWEHKGEVNLKIQDNGEGLTDNFYSDDNKPLGLQLIDQLTKQLNGSYSCEPSQGGTLFLLAFQKADCKGASNASL